MIRPPCLSILFLVALFTTGSKAQNAASVRVTPRELAASMIHKPAFVENAKGENFCWHARVGMEQFVDNYKLTKNTEWLDAGIQYFDFLVSTMDTDPDGYRGWIGPYGYDTKYWQDSHVGDAILLTDMLDFSALVLEDPQLAKKYGAKAKEYTQIAARDFVEKYDQRKTWIEDGPYGSYIGFSKFLKPGELTQWVYDPDVSRAGISHPFNKQMDCAQVCLRLYRITGKKFYRDRAEKIYFTAKSHFQYHAGHYHWNYFEPLTPGDIDLEKKETRHWVSVHPFRSGYQAGEVAKIAEAYHYGIVFNEEDMKRIVRTNLEVMWNGDALHPEFINSNHLGPKDDTTGLAAFKRAYDHSNFSKNTGELWTGLLDFDQRIRDLYELRFQNDKNSERYVKYNETVLASPPGFRRKYASGEVRVPTMSFSDSKELYLATVLPYEVRKGQRAILVCKSNTPGELKVDLYSKAGKKLENLFTENIDSNRTIVQTWDGKTPGNRKGYRGEYVIRWSVGTGYREYPVLLR
ncbi:MAG TPA: hypothetical protein VF490_02620 [Chryseosolibacter sp.]